MTRNLITKLSTLLLGIVLVLLAATVLYAAMTAIPAKTAVTPQALTRTMAPVVYSLNGFVQDNGGRGLEGATVTVGHQSATSMAGGSYQFARLSAGIFPVSVVKPGYTPYTGTITINGAVTQNFKLSGAYTMSGYIRDPSGVPMSGAVLEVLQNGKQRYTAAADGAYSAGGLIPGNMGIRLYENAQNTSGGVIDFQNVNVIGNMSKDFILILPGTGTLRGYVKDAGSGAPISGASIVVDGVRMTTSKADGSYSLSGIKLSYYDNRQGAIQSSVVASKSGYSSRTLQVYIKADTAYDLGMPPAGAVQTYTMSGYIRDPSGVPMSGAVLEVLQNGKQRYTAAADGAYSAGGLIPGNMGIRLYENAQNTSGGVIDFQNVNVIGNMSKDFILILPGTGTLRGYVKDAGSGAPISGASIVVDGVRMTTSKADGSYSLSGIKLSYYDHRKGAIQSSVVISKSGYSPRTLQVYIKADTAYDLGMPPAGAVQ